MAFEFLEEQETGEEEMTPSLEEVMKRTVEAMSRNMRVSMPGKIIKYDKEKQLADVQPVFKQKYRDGTVEDPPIIYNVPVAHARAGNAFLHMPIAEGHSVMLVFQDKSLEKWISSGGVHDPEDTRSHHISDAIAYPGGYPSNDASKIHNGEDAILGNSDGDKNGHKTEIRVKKNGKLQVVNKKYDLIFLLDELIRIIREAVVYTDNGPQNLKHVEFGQIHQKFKTFVSKG